MALGPGKYDDLCTYVRLKAHAVGAAVIVWGPTDLKGPGFSVQAPPEFMPMLADVLESIIKTIREDVQKDISAYTYPDELHPEQTKPKKESNIGNETN